MTTASLWNPTCSSVEAVAASAVKTKQEFIAIADQTVFDLTVFTFLPSTYSIEIHRNGLLLDSSDYTENSSGKSFTLTVPAAAGDLIIAEGYLDMAEGPVVIAPGTATPADLANVMVILLEVGDAGTTPVEVGLASLGILPLKAAIDAAPPTFPALPTDQFAVSHVGSSVARSLSLESLTTYFNTLYHLKSPTVTPEPTPEPGTSSSEPTGTIKAYIGVKAPTGYLLASGAFIGDAVSTGDAIILKSALAHNLFVLIWDSISDAICPVLPSRGLTAESDWLEHKIIALPDLRGRVIAGKDNMDGGPVGRLSPTFSTVMGGTDGTESTVLTLDQIPSHTHTVTSSGWVTSFGSLDGGLIPNTSPGIEATGTAGGGLSHSSLQPTIVLNYIIKL